MHLKKLIPIIGFCVIPFLTGSAMADQHEWWLVNSKTGKCLDGTATKVEGDDAYKVQVFECLTSHQAENWLFDQPEQENITNLYWSQQVIPPAIQPEPQCLDMRNKGANHQVTYKKCNSHLKAQNWDHGEVEKEVQIKNKYWKLCLTVVDGDAVEGKKCDPKDPAQLWTWEHVPKKEIGCSSQSEKAPITHGKHIICSFSSPGACTKDINICGNPSQCKCPVGYFYNPATYTCDLSFKADQVTKDVKRVNIPGTPKDAICSFAPPETSICVLNINICGHSSHCTCPVHYFYNPATGKCDLKF